MTRTHQHGLVLSLLTVLALGGCASRGHLHQQGTESLGTGSFGDRAEPAPAAAPAEPVGAADALEAEADEAEGTIARAKRSRPGLGTSFGEQHHSEVVTTRFERANANAPDVLLSLWYDDAAGVRDMARYKGDSSWSTSRIGAAGGNLVVSVVDERGAALPCTRIEGRPYVIGEADQRYLIGVENNSPYRYEVVGSVDGLDVIDGETAGFYKRGYVVDPYTSTTIEGWRTSTDTVAAFRFSDIEDSYAERKGKGRNIGVIGVAFFHELGAVDWAELQRRDSAEPFPGRYAQPPPR
jgi:hypothetical protein